MKTRSIWTGTLKVSLVQFPVRVHSAVNNSEKINFNQLHKNCHQRVRQKLVCPVHGEIERAQIVKGYEYDKDQYCVVDDSELDQVRLETTRVIDLVQFVRLEELDLACLDAPYLLTPGSRIGIEGFCVLREALRRSQRIGIGQVVLSGRERLVALLPIGRGLGFFTLRFAAELRSAVPYFESLPDQVDQDQLTLTGVDSGENQRSCCHCHTAISHPVRPDHQLVGCAQGKRGSGPNRQTRRKSPQTAQGHCLSLPARKDVYEDRADAPGDHGEIREVLRGR